MKATTVAVGLAALAACLASPFPPGSTVVGTWGGTNAGLMADDTSGHVHIGCTFGNIHQAIVIGAGGNFHVPGDHGLRAYPIGPTLPAVFHGSVGGQGLTLSVTVSDTVADTTARLGPVRLTLGVEATIGPCPR